MPIRNELVVEQTAAAAAERRMHAAYGTRRCGKLTKQLPLAVKRGRIGKSCSPKNKDTVWQPALRQAN